MEQKSTTTKTTKKKKFTVNIKNMGINIDKNEYYEILMSNSNRPETMQGSSYGRGC